MAAIENSHIYFGRSDEAEELFKDICPEVVIEVEEVQLDSQNVKCNSNKRRNRFDIEENFSKRKCLPIRPSGFVVSESQILNEDSDIEISIDSNNYLGNQKSFDPIDQQWQIDKCLALNLGLVKKHNFSCGVRLPNFHIKPIQADGNCFYRCISWILTGCEEQHVQIRSLIIKHMKSIDIMLQEKKILPYPHNVESYLKNVRQSMIVGRWASSVEIYVAANLLNTDIYTVSGGRWLLFSPQLIINPLPSDERRGIYLHHKNNVHYDIIKMHLDSENFNYSSLEVNKELNVSIMNKVSEHLGLLAPETLSFQILNNSSSSSLINDFEKSIQLHCVASCSEEGSNHFLVSIFRNNEILLYDSQYNKYVSDELLHQLDFIYLSAVNDVTVSNYVRFENCQVQLNQCDSGVFAIFNMMLLYHGLEPAEYECNSIIRMRNFIKNFCHDGVIKVPTCKILSDLGRQLKKRQSNIKRSYVEKGKNVSDNGNMSITEDFSIGEISKKRIAMFKNDVRTGCVYRCVSCNIMMYSHSKKNKFMEKLKNKFQVNGKEYLLNAAISLEPQFSNDYSKGKIVMCSSCSRIFDKCQIPKFNQSNGLEIETVPEELKLTELESVLISKEILFLKICALPTSRWDGFVDKVVNVLVEDNDIIRTQECLPRLPSEAGLIAVDLKRKRDMKNSVWKQLVNVHKLGPALKMLKQLGHPSYEFVEECASYLNKFDDSDGNIGLNNSSDLNHNVEMNIHSENFPNEDCTIVNDSKCDENEISSNISDFQCLEDNNLVLTHCNPEVRLIQNRDKNSTLHKVNTESKVGVIIAPGEDKIPVNIMRNNDWDINAFPHLFPSGRFGMHYPRDQKLTIMQYSKTRLLSCDKRFSSCSAYVFALCFIYEKLQLERNISISYIRGKKQSISDGVSKIVNHDGFSVLNKIKGSDRYWQEAKYEMLASVEQLGPFQLFFTLSCGDKRWIENYVTIFMSENRKIEYTSEFHSDNEEALFCEENILIDGVPFKEFVANNPIHDIFRKNVLIIVRNFDRRLQCFKKHILMSSSNSMNVKYFRWRIEFQLRGAPHVHGVLWLDLSKLAKLEVNGLPRYPNLENIIDKLQFYDNIDNEAQLVLSRFIDDYITCSRLYLSIRHIVDDVNWHYHSKSCKKKKETDCRFGFPKFPSDHTIIAMPLDKDMEPEQRDYVMEKLKAVLLAVKMVLRSFPCKPSELDNYLIDNNVDISWILRVAKVAEKDYYEALSVSCRGITIVLKRSPSEIFINNYNPEWIAAWNANLDIQLCLDHYAVSTYITDYYSKTESKVNNMMVSAFQENKGENVQFIMRMLAQVYLTHRKMGLPEAYYRLIDRLFLKESNLKCRYISCGFPKNRYKFMVKGNGSRSITDNDEHVSSDCEVDEIDLDNSVKEKCLIEGLESKGFFQEHPNVNDYYSRRPKLLEKMCFAQFFMSYDSCYARKKISFDGDISEDVGSHCVISLIDEEKIPLPMIIKCNGKAFRLRNVPCIVRRHKYNKIKEPHEFMFSEICLFVPWRSESELYQNDFEMCQHVWSKPVPTEVASAYDTGLSYVQAMRKMVFPNWDLVEGSRSEYLENANMRPEHVGDFLDSKMVQNEEDDEFDGMHKNMEYGARDLDLLSLPKDNNNKNTVSFSVAIYPPEKVEVMLNKVRKLVPEQRVAFDIALKYARDVSKARSNSNFVKPKPFLLIVHGGAGSGKSLLIDSVSDWCGKEFATRGDVVDRPYILLCAHTGAAASIIKGITLHSAFNLDFGNAYLPMSDKKRDEFQNLYSNLKIVIIDEFSFVSSDLLYNLHRRLQDIKQCQDDFGGVSVMLFGDLMQLSPVSARFIFEKPRNSQLADSYELNNLFLKFSNVELIRNHRQGSAAIYADLLKRIRFGEYSDEDFQLLRSRVISEPFPEDAVYIFGTNKAVNEINEKKLNQVEGELFSVAADAKYGSRQSISTDAGGYITGCRLLKDFKFKVGAKVCLTFNVDVSDYLTNGAMGKIASVTKNDNGIVTEILVEFNDPKVGEKIRREEGIEDTFDGRKLTPIRKIMVPVQKGKHRSNVSSVTQFPLALAWAVTAHKFQGQTIKYPTYLITDFNTIFQGGQAYVILSRVERFEQICFIDCPETIKGKKVIRVNKKAFLVAKSLQAQALNLKTFRPWYVTSDNILKLVFANIRSLNKHFVDIKLDDYILQSDVLALTETHISSSANLADLMEKFCLSMFPYCTFVNAGKGKGIVVYSKYPLIIVQQYNESSLQCLVFEVKHKRMIVLYRSINYSLSSLKLKLMSNILEKNNTIVFGDFNFNYNGKETNGFTKYMNNIGMSQAVEFPTIDSGNILDHLYISAENEYTIEGHTMYDRDHDAICCMIA